MSKFSINRCLFAIITSLILSITSFISPTFAGGNKELVCHESKSGKIKSLMVSENAVDAHTAHGDLGPFEFYPDADGDGWGSPDIEPVILCDAPEGYVTGFNGFDCDDTTTDLANDCTTAAVCPAAVLDSLNEGNLYPVPPADELEIYNDYYAGANCTVAWVPAGYNILAYFLDDRVIVNIGSYGSDDAVTMEESTACSILMGCDD